MLFKRGRLSFAARLPHASALLASLCLSAAQAQQRPEPPTQREEPRRPTISAPPVTEEQRRRRDVLFDVGRPAPTMRKAETVGLPAREARTYDPKRDATYVNVPVTLLAHKAVKGPKGVLSFEGRELTLTFQLAYRGRQTYDLVSSFLIVESTAPRAEPDRLGGVGKLEIKADPYEYAYERLEYQAGPLTPSEAIRQELRRETAAFPLPPEDLPQIAGAGRLQIKLGPDTYTVKSPDLSELRRTLAAGAGK